MVHTYQAERHAEHRRQLTWPAGVLSPVFNRKFRRHLMRCGKSETKIKCRAGSQGCWTLQLIELAVACAPIIVHIFLFQVAPPVVTKSTNSPLFSASIVASVTTLARTSAFMLPFVAKQPMTWFHFSRNGTNRTTNPWSDVLSFCVVNGPKSTKPSITPDVSLTNFERVAHLSTTHHVFCTCQGPLL